MLKIQVEKEDSRQTVLGSICITRNQPRNPRVILGGVIPSSLLWLISAISPQSISPEVLVCLFLCFPRLEPAGCHALCDAP